jgi:hypothetical protein
MLPRIPVVQLRYGREQATMSKEQQEAADLFGEHMNRLFKTAEDVANGKISPEECNRIAREENRITRQCRGMSRQKMLEYLRSNRAK